MSEAVDLPSVEEGIGQAGRAPDIISHMWTTFWPDLLVAVIGALLTVGIAYATYILNVRSNEQRALTSLIMELHHRRAFTGQAVRVDDAHELEDYAHSNASVLNIKDEVRRARDNVRALPALQEPLSRMTRDCNIYLETVQQDPDTYVIELIRLRDELLKSIKRLALARKSLAILEPGGGALEH